jgi:hypothetical protein
MGLLEARIEGRPAWGVPVIINRKLQFRDLAKG